MQVTTLGIDLAKTVFQLHGVDARGHAVLTRRVKRSQLVDAVASLSPCVIGMEACASAHHWGRVFEKLGHTVKLMSPKYVKPYVKTQKNDFRDAEAICEAVSRPTMRFVAIKTVDQVDLQAVHRSRTLLIKTRTALINQIRGLLGEYGLVIARSPEQVRPALVRLVDEEQTALTPFARETFSELYEQLVDLEQRIAKVTQRLERVFRGHPVCRKLAAVPGVGPLTATALLAAVSRPHVFQNGRHLAAWLGLVPAQHSSGGKDRPLGLSKRGDGYLRRQLIHGARALVWCTPGREVRLRSWIDGLRARRPFNAVVAAVANKLARILWAMLSRGEVYRTA